MLPTSLSRWMYHNHRPNWLARFLNSGSHLIQRTGLVPQMAHLEVIGRKSGQRIALPVAIATVGGQRYLVSMLGNEAQWVHNVRAAQGRAYLDDGAGHIEIHLEEVPTIQRALILKAYLQIAPGARPHIPVDKDAPLTEFEAIAPQFPVFRIVPYTDKCSAVLAQ